MMALHSLTDLKPVRSMTRLDILEIARDWIGTPYRHQACLKGVGADCLGLLRGIYGEVYGFIPVVTINYSSKWIALTRGKDPLLTAAHSWLILPPQHSARPGDVVLFKINREGPYQHCAIMNTGGEIIHSFDRHHVLSSAPSDVWFRPHRMKVFHWPGVN